MILMKRIGIGKSIVASVTVVTPAIPERIGNWLPQTIHSVNSQTVLPETHIVGFDYERIGCAAMMARLLPAVNTEWFVPLADDDVLHPGFLERLLGASEGADVVYPWCNVSGRNWNPNSHFDAGRLMGENYIPSTALIRTSTFRELGGYDPVVCEDWSYWVKVVKAGKVIRCLPEVLWDYRFHHDEYGRPENISEGWQYEWHNWHGYTWSHNG